MTVMNPPFAFRDWARRQQLTYSILTAKAPMDDLISELQGIFQIQSHQSNLPLTGNLSDLPGIPVVKFNNNPWSAVYWSIGRAPILQYDCGTLSGKLNTRVLHLIESDTSGWVE